MPTTSTASTTAQLDQDIATADAATSGGFVIDIGANITETANLDAINLQSDAQLTIDGSGSGGSFTLHGAGSFGFIVDSGAVTIENLDISDAVLAGGSSSATLTLSNDVFAGNVAISHNLTVYQAAPVTLGDASGPATVTNEAGSTYDIGATTSGMVPGPIGVSRFINKGTLLGSSGISEFYVDVIDTGTLSVVGGNNLRFFGANNSFSGTYIGGGMIDYWTGSTDALGTIDMTDGACTTVSSATVNQSGVVTLSTNTTITIAAGSWNFTSDNGLVPADPSDPGGAAVNLDGGTLAKTGGAGTTVIECDFNGGGGTIRVASGVLAFNGLADSFSEAISGAGAFSIGGGGTDAIDGGTTIDTSSWIITGVQTDVALNEALSYSGTFKEQSGSILTLTPSNNLTLTHSAIFTDATVGGSGTLTLAGAKATMNGGTIGADVSIEIQSGTLSAIGTTSDSGTLDVLSGGRVDAVTFLVGAMETISARSVDDGARISGGTQFVYGLASAATVFAGAQVVESGGVANGTTLSGGSETVSSGGTDGGAKIRGGTQFDYGLAGGATVFAGAQVVKAGGTANNTTISRGGTLLMTSGGSADLDRILPGGAEVVGFGAIDNGARVSGGTQEVLGVASAATVSSGGAQVIESGGVASGTIVKGGGTEVLESAGVVSGLTLSAGATLELVGSTTSTSPLALPVGVILAAGSGEVFSGFGVGSSNPVEVLSAGLDSGGAVSGGGKLTISSDGIDSGTIIFKGGTEIVSSGGTAVSAVVGSGGELIVLSGGSAVDTNVLSGGTAVVSAGGALDVQSGATDSGSLINAGTISLASGTTLSLGAVTLTNAKAVDLSGGAGLLLDGNVTLTGGGTVSMGDSGNAIDAAGGASVLTNSNDTIVGSGTIGGANLTLHNNGTIDATGQLTISTGGSPITNAGTLEATSSGTLVIDGNVTNSKIIEALGARATVSINAATVTNTGTAIIRASGDGAQIDLGGAVISGGTLQTLSGGAIAVGGSGDLIRGGTIAANALVEVGSGGTLTVSGGTVGSGGILETLGDGTAIVTGTVSNGGTLYASGSGSLVQIAAGAVVNGGTIEVGNGIVDIQSGGAAAISFLSSGSGGLDLDAVGSGSFKGKVSGFGGSSHTNSGQYIDLTGVAYVSGSMSGTYSGTAASGVLTVSSGGTVVATIDMVGNYLTSDFHLTSGNGGSGTIITDPSIVDGGRVHSANVALFGSHIASFAAAGHGGSVITNALQAAQELPLLAQPHR